MKKFEFNRRDTTIAAYAFLVLAAIVALVFLLLRIHTVAQWLRTVLGVIKPFLYGFAIAYLILPILRFFESLFTKKLSRKSSRRLAILVSYLLVFAVVTLFVMVVSPTLASNITTIIDNSRTYSQQVQEVLAFFQKFTDQEAVPAEIAKTVENIISGVYSLLSTSLVSLLGITTRLTGEVVQIFVGFVVSIYMLAGKETVFASIRKGLSAFLEEKQVQLLTEIVHDANRKFSGFISGKLLDSLIIGVLCTVIMSLLKLPFPTLIGLIVGVTNVIPYFGPFIGAIPSAVLVLVGGDMLQLLEFVVFILLLQQFDGNILGPRILGQSIGISSVWVIFSILLFGKLCGFIGMIIGVPLMAVILELISRFINSRLRSRGQSTDLRDYASDENQLI